MGASSAARALDAVNGDQATAAPLSFRHRNGFWKDALRRRMLALADMCAATGAIVALALLVPGTHELVRLAIASLPLALLLAKVQGLYDADHRRLRHLTTDEIPSLFMWITLWIAATALLVSLLGVPGLDGRAAAVMWVSAFTVAVALRGGVRELWRRIVPREVTLVLGDGELARMLARKLTLEPGHHVAVLSPGAAEGVLAAGFPSDPEPPLVAGEDSPFDLEDGLAPAIRALGIERVVVAREDLDEASFERVMRTCRTSRAKLSVMPPLPAMHGTAVGLTRLAELPLIEFKTWDPSRSTMLLKRLLDVAGSALAIVLLAVPMALVAVAIRLDSPGPALFRQRRAGRDGRPFSMLKFRTMVRDAELLLPQLVDLSALEDPMFKLRDDPRVTRVGRVLRRLSLDELPQLLNVLAGQMSLVGPRPEEVRLVVRYDETERFRLHVRPGMTGPMQVHGRGELTFAERLAVEREYVENYSFRKDVSLLLKTAGAVLRGRGAY
jgi:exopolysaccharide biosynthesis polyprenyl glycosylphosphotransferase